MKKSAFHYNSLDIIAGGAMSFYSYSKSFLAYHGSSDETQM